MKAGVAFKTTDPEVLEAIEHYAAARAVFNEKMQALSLALKPYGTLRYRAHRGGCRVIGVGAPSSTQMPDGWRFYVTSGLWEPNRRSKAGKELGASLPVLATPTIPGWSSLAFGDSETFTTMGYFVFPKVFDGVAWVGYPEAINERNGAPTEPWEPARYSDYIRVCEDAEVQP